MIGVYAILQVSEKGWTSGEVLGLGALSLVLLTAFVLRQARIETPLMPLRLFRSRNVSGANLVLILLVVGMFGMFFLGALYMQRILGYDAARGRARVPARHDRDGHDVAVRVGAGRDALRRAARCSSCASPAMGAAMLLFARTPVDGHFVVDLLPIMLLFGFGAGLAFPALMQLAMSGATPSDMGLASGLANTSPQVGGAVGLAVLATIAANRTDDAALAGRRRRWPRSTAASTSPTSSAPRSCSSRSRRADGAAAGPASGDGARTRGRTRREPVYSEV